MRMRRDGKTASRCPTSRRMYDRRFSRVASAPAHPGVCRETSRRSAARGRRIVHSAASGASGQRHSGTHPAPKQQIVHSAASGAARRRDSGIRGIGAAPQRDRTEQHDPPQNTASPTRPTPAVPRPRARCDERPQNAPPYTQTRGTPRWPASKTRRSSR